MKENSPVKFLDFTGEFFCCYLWSTFQMFSA